MLLPLGETGEGYGISLLFLTTKYKSTICSKVFFACFLSLRLMWLKFKYNQAGLCYKTQKHAMKIAEFPLPTTVPVRLQRKLSLLFTGSDILNTNLNHLSADKHD